MYQQSTNPVQNYFHSVPFHFFSKNFQKNNFFKLLNFRNRFIEFSFLFHRSFFIRNFFLFFFFFFLISTDSPKPTAIAKEERKREKEEEETK